jgi:hypothetical protein
MIVALATVGAMVLIALGALVIAYFCRSNVAIVAACLAPASTIAGALANSLASPSGISSVIASARKGPQ